MRVCIIDQLVSCWRSLVSRCCKVASDEATCTALLSSVVVVDRLALSRAQCTAGVRTAAIAGLKESMIAPTFPQLWCAGKYRSLVAHRVTGAIPSGQDDTVAAATCSNSDTKLLGPLVVTSFGHLQLLCHCTCILLGPFSRHTSRAHIPHSA